MHSQLQTQILRFHREVLKWVYTRPQPLRTKLSAYYLSQMSHNRSLPRLKFNHIQHLLRSGRNRFTMLKQSNIDDINIH